ncbi:ATP-binding protein [Candidatus Zixiibacteriota bacterium]
MTNLFRQISVSSASEALETLLQFCRSFPGIQGDQDLLLTIELIIEETVLNILNHGYGETEGPIELSIEANAVQTRLIIRDRSPKFDPHQVEQPEMHLMEGKRGLSMVTRLALSTSWEYSEDRWNMLTIILPAPGGSHAA